MTSKPISTVVVKGIDRNSHMDRLYGVIKKMEMDGWSLSKSYGHLNNGWKTSRLVFEKAQGRTR